MHVAGRCQQARYIVFGGSIPRGMGRVWRHAVMEFHLRGQIVRFRIGTGYALTDWNTWAHRRAHEYCRAFGLHEL